MVIHWLIVVCILVRVSESVTKIVLNITLYITHQLKVQEQLQAAEDFSTVIKMFYFCHIQDWSSEFIGGTHPAPAPRGVRCIWVTTSSYIDQTHLPHPLVQNISPSRSCTFHSEFLPLPCYRLKQIARGVLFIHLSPWGNLYKVPL